ncbi:hypothetical protein MVLG_05463 [Microbotryum lychnidis-dioicae p1A1 Lamole]|uniref:Uncharacterized protein n=1 Tax=Microbotryum lychnidis-dioicae (strain p1A1 Lamole / MvSl-1064) TaxID=683840 RepID=U5HEB8_USTV1|nr:hypothetical protein MVLG_05463 [Microbotryum lychnidis-dioicae p1A1 Lamole]|eukprot:KDE04093.1 hypothetical protein MVLG_05463 [Microbotryum lychnidis-dioicae p1A1 Lamole]
MSSPPHQARYGRLASGSEEGEPSLASGAIAEKAIGDTIISPIPVTTAATTTSRGDSVTNGRRTEPDEARSPIMPSRTRTRQRSRDNGRGLPRSSRDVAPGQVATPSAKPNSAYTLDRTLLELPLDWSKPTSKDRTDHIMKLVLGTFFLISILILTAIVFTELGHDIWPDRPSSAPLHPVLGDIRTSDGGQDSVLDAVVTTDIEGDLVVVPIEQGGAENRYGRRLGARSWKG